MDNPSTPVIEPRDRTVEMLCHLLGLAFWTAIPFAGILAPMFLWLWKRDGNPSVDEHGREAVNFQISITIYAIIAGVLMWVLIGFILLPIVLLSQIVLTIIGGIEANKGRLYRYPLTIRLL